MKKEVRLLDHGLFEKPFMDSKARTRAVSTKEIAFGHLIGPLGLILIVNTIAALVEKFFTQQTGAMYGTANVNMIRIMGSRYEVGKDPCSRYGALKRMAGSAYTFETGKTASLVSDFWFLFDYYWCSDFSVCRTE